MKTPEIKGRFGWYRKLTKHEQQILVLYGVAASYLEKQGIQSPSNAEIGALIVRQRGYEMSQEELEFCDGLWGWPYIQQWAFAEVTEFLISTGLR